MEKLKNEINLNVDLLSDLIALIKKLRGENGCPWDQKQTLRSMSVYLIEEVYELVDAIQKESPQLIMEELGDVLFQIFFIFQLFNEDHRVSLKDVVSANIEKMKHRHPHVFGDQKIENADQVKIQWQKIKSREKRNALVQESILNSIPVGLPALLRAYRISERAAGIGFDWDNIIEVMEQVKEEWAEFVSEIDMQQMGDKVGRNVSMEFGDIIFSLVNVARFAKIHPDTALLDSIQKFERRFRLMEKTALQRGQKLEDLTRREWDNLWQIAKLHS